MYRMLVISWIVFISFTTGLPAGRRQLRGIILAVDAGPAQIHAIAVVAERKKHVFTLNRDTEIIGLERASGQCAPEVLITSGVHPNGSDFEWARTIVFTGYRDASYDQVCKVLGSLFDAMRLGNRDLAMRQFRLRETGARFWSEVAPQAETAGTGATRPGIDWRSVSKLPLAEGVDCFVPRLASLFETGVPATRFRIVADHIVEAGVASLADVHRFLTFDLPTDSGGSRRRREVFQ